MAFKTTWSETGMAMTVLAVLAGLTFGALRAWVWFSEAMGWRCRHEWCVTSISHEEFQSPMGVGKTTVLVMQCIKDESHMFIGTIPGHHEFELTEEGDVPQVFRDAMEDD